MEINSRSLALRIVALVGATLYIASITFIRVFPMYVPFSDVSPIIQLVLTGLMGLGLVAVARFSRYPLLPIVAVALLAIAGVDLIQTCLAISCPIPPDYEPWRNLKVFFDWGFVGPRLELSSRPDRCAGACPHRIELLPLALAYAAIWIGAAEPTVPQP